MVSIYYLANAPPVANVNVNFFVSQEATVAQLAESLKKEVEVI